MAESVEHKPAIIVIGGSAGAVEALTTLVAGLPGDLPAAVFVALHIGARRSRLPAILAGAGPLPAAWAIDGEEIRPGRIFVAPPDLHLLLEACHMRLSRGPPENRTRPAVDPLFRSAARNHGPRVIGVVLSGALADGTAGLAEVKRHGGIGVVQEPEEARFPDMPLSALRNTRVDHRAQAWAMGPLLASLARRQAMPSEAALGGAPGTTEADPVEPTRMTGEEGAMTSEGGYELNPPVALTCPTCGGALTETTVDSLPYFSCHIGHRFAAPDMDEAQCRQLEQVLEVALRALNERAALCRRMAWSLQAKGFASGIRRWEEAEHEALLGAQAVRGFIERGWLRPDPDGDETAGISG